MKAIIGIVLAMAATAIAAHATAQVTYYERPDFEGHSFAADRQIANFASFGFNDRASSVVVERDRWEVCEDVRFGGKCVVLRPGAYRSLAAMGLNNRISSMRAVGPNVRIDDKRYAPLPAPAQVTFFERPGFEGRTFTTRQQINNLGRAGFNDHASSVVVARDRWEVCADVQFGGRCVVLRPGAYPSLAALKLNNRISSARAVSWNTRIDDGRFAPLPAAAQITFYELGGFQGRWFTTNKQIGNFGQFGFNDRASSVDVIADRWEICEGAKFSGQCVVLRPGRYPSLAAMGLNNRISSVRLVRWDAHIDDHRYAPAPVARRDGRDYRRRGDERLYEANVTSVRAVAGTPEQRCWVEREQVVQERNDVNVLGAVAGAIIGGILGHQVGGGSGQDIATAGGVVAGGVVGANVGRGGQQAQTQDVQRCANMPGPVRPDYWDVTYNFRGQEHRVQMIAPPGPTVTVNEQGEPRA